MSDRPHNASSPSASPIGVIVCWPITKTAFTALFLLNSFAISAKKPRQPADLSLMLEVGEDVHATSRRSGACRNEVQSWDGQNQPSQMRESDNGRSTQTDPEQSRQQHFTSHLDCFCVCGTVVAPKHEESRFGWLDDRTEEERRTLLFLWSPEYEQRNGHQTTHTIPTIDV
ncbi:hypothetical protein BLNAU_22669 [Blattamonas nauphoetae]|uniref:Secreted protein n=1 Tax=Blattamonas nauphoetae TaxID=2049346 RepID=A0ABQ9WSH1_9EUKA|nr:hypothetical protein BLNAU_22669 [Blattamonas nauphoetae]